MTRAKFMVAATLGKSYGLQYQNGAIVSAYTKTKSFIDNMAFMFWGWHFTSSVWVCWAVIGNDATKLYTV